MAPSIDLIIASNSLEGHTTIKDRYWNNNLLPSNWTENCPVPLMNLGAKDVGILSGKQEDYRNMSWMEAKGLVESNTIDRFHRSPLALRRYLCYMHHLKKQHGSVLSFVQKKRLYWDSVVPSGRAPFEDATDLRIIYNDWPYGIDPEVTHLVVWVKFILEDDPETGFLTPEHHQLIEGYVQKTFCGEDGVQRDKLIWFKNWKSLKSVHALEHFHVMLYQAPAAFLKRITGNDRPMCEVVNDL